MVPSEVPNFQLLTDFLFYFLTSQRRVISTNSVFIIKSRSHTLHIKKSMKLAKQKEEGRKDL